MYTRNGSNKVTRVFDGAPVVRMTDSAIASGLAFLQGELEKRDPKLYEPLSSVTWPRDIVSDTGGGWTENTSSTFVNYGTTGGGTSGIIGSDTNDIPVVQANIEKDTYQVFSWAHQLRVPFVAQNMLKGIGRDLTSILDKGIKLGWNKDLDYMVYEGYPELDVFGLVNNPDVPAALAKAGAGGGTEWATKTPDEIVEDINSLLTETWQASEYDLSGMANHVLIDPANYAHISSRKVSDAGNISIKQYVLENNIAKDQDRDLKIYPSRWCSEAGTGSKKRMVAYVNEKDKIRIDIPVMLSRIMTQPDVTQMAYLTAYAGQIGQVRFQYLSTIRYKDGI